MTSQQDIISALRSEFIRLLTTDSPHHDRRRRDFNEAVFMPGGTAVWTQTTLGMITSAFDRAAATLEQGI